jgi:hypothetical protein
MLLFPIRDKNSPHEMVTVHSRNRGSYAQFGYRNFSLYVTVVDHLKTYLSEHPPE